MGKVEKMVKKAVISSVRTLASKVISFIETLRLQSGSYVGLPFKLRSWQQEIVKIVYEDSRQVRTAILTLPRKNGKCLALHTQIPTPLGFKEMGDLKLGDKLFGPDGKHCSITGISEIKYDTPCFRLYLADGQQFIANDEHLWPVRTNKGIEKRTTKEIYYFIKRYPKEKVEFPLGMEIEYSEKELSIDPYLFGLWYGHAKKSSNIGHIKQIPVSKIGAIRDFCHKKKYHWYRREAHLSSLKCLMYQPDY